MQKNPVNTCKYWEKLPTASTGDRRISEPSTVSQQQVPCILIDLLPTSSPQDSEFLRFPFFHASILSPLHDSFMK